MERSLADSFRIGLRTLAEAAGAYAAALFATRSTGLALLTQIEITQGPLDITHTAWARRRARLEDGHIERYGAAVVWPLFDGPDLVALVYLDRAPQGFPDDETRETAAVLAARVGRSQLPVAMNSYLTTRLNDPRALEEFQRDQLAVSLHVSGGNVAASARQLGVSRQTVYARMDRLGVELSEFRRRR